MLRNVLRLKIFEGKCVEKCVRYWRAYVGERERVCLKEGYGRELS